MSQYISITAVCYISQHAKYGKQDELRPNLGAEIRTLTLTKPATTHYIRGTTRPRDNFGVIALGVGLGTNVICHMSKSS